MIVVDASLAVEIALATERGLRALAQAIRSSGRFHAPHLIDLEVAQTLRKLVFRGEISERIANVAIEDFLKLRIERAEHELFIERIWSLRHEVTAYDAAYIALAEALQAPLWTLDGRLARSAGHVARIEWID